MSSPDLPEKTQVKPIYKNRNSMIIGVFQDVTRHTEYWNRWIVDKGWVDAIKSRFNIPVVFAFDTKHLNSAIARSPVYNCIDDIAIPNPYGIYKAKYFKSKVEGNKKVTTRVTAYYITTPGKLPIVPGGSTKWYETAVSDAPKPRNTRNEPNMAKRFLPVLNRVPTDTAPDPKRSRRSTSIPTSSIPAVEEAAPGTVSAAILGQTYWESPEAMKLFGVVVGKGEEMSQDVLVDIDSRLERLTYGVSNPMGWKMLLDDFDQKDLCSSNEIFNIQTKSRYVCAALKYAVVNMPSQTWKDCCCFAIDTLAQIGHTEIKHWETIRLWHRHFRMNRECFTNPAIQRRYRTQFLPPLLHRNPELKDGILSYARQNIDRLTAELICHYLYTKGMPVLLEQCKKERGDPGLSMHDLLQEHGLTKICVSTVYKWLKQLGFRFEARKKCYYVDGHERPETIAYRKRFVFRYLEMERRMHRWIQMSAAAAIDIAGDNCGHRYVHPTTGEDWVEFHVDDSPGFQDMVAKTEFGGNLSVRMPLGTKPLICFGQDECIFKQFLFTAKSWTLPDGQKAVIPKDEGHGVMISAMTSREFGFGMVLSEEDLLKINTARENKKYSDEEAAVAVRGHSTKNALTSSPFVIEFEYGKEGEGYWDYNHMVLQLEDCADVVQILHPTYDYIFLFDHSCGHDKQRPDGLSVNRMTKSFGGAQPAMRNYLLLSDEYLGSYEHDKKLRAGEEQEFVYKGGDDGPFWMSIAEREERRHDKTTDKIVKKKFNKSNLKEKLTAMGLVPNGTREALQKLCIDNNIPISEEISKIVEGWEGKPKGMIQVLWERGFIDPTKGIKDYTLNGRKDMFGNCILDTSLKEMMESLLDFMQEETLLQYHGRMSGVVVDRTPKCHPELAGEGIEYCWGCAKGYYRRLPISKKRGKVNFKAAVKQSLSVETVLTKIRVRMFSWRARQYILAYHSLAGRENIDAAETGPDAAMSAHLIEKIVKTYKTHRCASDFDAGFIGTVVKTMTTHNV